MNEVLNREQQAIAEAPVATMPRTPNMAMVSAGANALVQRTLGEVQVAVMMAKQFPRDKIVAREKLVNDCCREGLAAVSKYVYARGGTEITGPTIRFAEAVKNAWGNIQSGYRELSRTKGPDGVGVSEVEAFAWDTENNTRESTTFMVRHWRDTKKGGYALTDERDIRELISNQSKRVERTCILNSVDGDIIEAGLTQCDTTLTTQVKATPERIAAMVKAFGDFGVTQAQIEKRIQRRIDAINPALIISLTKIYNSLKDGMSKAEDWFEAEAAVDEKEEGKKTKTEKVKDKIANAKAAGADPETGELPADKKAEPKAEEKKPEEKPAETAAAMVFTPALIKCNGKPGNEIEPDFSDWKTKWVAMVNVAPHENGLKALHKNCQGILGQMQGRDKATYEECMAAMKEKADSFAEARGE